MEDGRIRRGSRVLIPQDPHDAHLLRDLAAINTRTTELLGPLPPGGMPILPKRGPAMLLEQQLIPCGVEEEVPAMPKLPIQVAAVASFALAACAIPGAATSQLEDVRETPPMQSARYTYPETPVITSGELVPVGDPITAHKLNYKPVEWPLRFERHSFSARCYDTLECEVMYDEVRHGDAKPSPPASTYGTNYLEGWMGGHGGITNFPPPAEVFWTSKDGTKLRAEIDIAGIFSDELVRHFVPREEVSDLPDGRNESPPSILLEVNDRTIRVYMKASVPTKHFQTPGNRHSTSRRDLVLVRTYTY